VTGLEVLLLNMKEQASAVGPVLAEVTERASGLLRELTEGGLKDELWRWVGPRSYCVLALEAADDGEPWRRMRQVARRVSEDLSQLSMHLPWLLGDEAEKRTGFFVALGEALAESGRSESGVAVLTGQASSPAWPQAVGGFCLGWARRDPVGVETALDGLLEMSGTWKGVLVASAWLLPSRASMRRLDRLVTRTDVTGVECARELAWSVPWDRLDAAEAAQLLGAIDDGSREVREQLLVALRRVVRRGAELSPQLLELSWSFLESTIPDKRESGGHLWDMLMSKLVDADFPRVLGLLKAALRESLRSAGVLGFEEVVPLTWGRVLAKDRAGLVRVMLEAVLDRASSVEASRALRELIRPFDDRDALLGFVEQTGVDGARLVAGALDAGHPGFWELARDLLVRSDGDHGVQAGLDHSVLSGTWSGSAVLWIESRLAGARGLASSSDPVVSSWALRMVSTLESWRTQEERADDEPWIWETRLQRREVEGLLAQPDSPERLWAIGRLLADAPDDRVRELLSADEILDALPRVSDIPEKQRRKWERWARHWSGRH
jgi:hypothetical protein